MAELGLGGMLMYYKLRITFDCTDGGCSWIEEFVNVKNQQEAESLVSKIAKDYGITQNYKADIKKSNIDEAIGKEKDKIWQKIRNQYILRKFNPDKLTVREYGKIQKELKDDKDKIYNVLKDENRYGSIYEFVKKKIDTKSVSVFAFEQIITDLYNAKTDKDFENIYNERILNCKKQEIWHKGE